MLPVVGEILRCISFSYLLIHALADVNLAEEIAKFVANLQSKNTAKK
jgi:hypothetical protein